MDCPRLFASLLLSLLVLGDSFAQETGRPFQRLDRNKDGKLTKDEFSGPLFERIDTNNDGVISAEEDRVHTRRSKAGRNSPQRIPSSVRAELDLPYAGTDNPRQRLDLYLPKKSNDGRTLPVVVFIHGGGWANGDKRGGYRTLSPLVQSGDYAGVSLGYRLSGEAIWPAQIEDCKSAIRWLRANAKKYNLDPHRIGVTGTSAGGHLAAVLGTSGDGPNAGHPRKDTARVQCVVDQFGPTELLTMGGWHDQANSPESKLIGGPIQENRGAARAASPVTHVSADDPPFLLIHGTKDRVVPFSQSEQLHAALQKVQVESVLVPVEGGSHGGFPAGEVAKRLRSFFDKHLRGQDVKVSSEPIQQTPNVGGGVRPETPKTRHPK